MKIGWNTIAKDGDDIANGVCWDHYCQQLLWQSHMAGLAIIWPSMVCRESPSSWHGVGFTELRVSGLAVYR